MLFNGHFTHSSEFAAPSAVSQQAINPEVAAVQPALFSLVDLTAIQQTVLSSVRPLEVLLEIVAQSTLECPARAVIFASYATLAALGSGHHPSVLRVLALLDSIELPATAATVSLLRQALALQSRWANGRNGGCFTTDCRDQLAALATQAERSGVARFADQLRVLSAPLQLAYRGRYCRFERTLLVKLCVRGGQALPVSN